MAETSKTNGRLDPIKVQQVAADMITGKVEIDDIERLAFSKVREMRDERLSYVKGMANDPALELNIRQEVDNATYERLMAGHKQKIENDISSQR